MKYRTLKRFHTTHKWKQFDKHRVFQEKPVAKASAQELNEEEFVIITLPKSLTLKLIDCLNLNNDL